MQIESVAITSLVEDPSNARKHDPKNLDAIKGSLAKFGQQKPIVVGKGNVVLAGNGTLSASKALGWDKINIVRTDLEGSEAIAYAIADNRTGELAAWNDDVLSRTLQGLKDDGIDLGAIGFDDEDLAQWLKTPEVVPGCDEDEVPEVTDTRCKPGDLWQLGNHRLLCGDSTNVQHVERLMGGEKADMVFTDPPYGMNLHTNYKTGWNTKWETSGLSGKERKMNDHRPVIGDDKEFDFLTAYAIFEYVTEQFWCGADYYCQQLPKGCGWLVWDKTGGNDSLMDVGFNANFENCWSKQKHKRDIIKHTFKGVAGMKKEDGHRVHPTQKPVGLAEHFIKTWCKGQNVIDLYLGSGSTLIACEKTNRRCFGMEIDPHYCDVILARWEKFTGKTAVLLTGEKQDA